MKAFQLIFLFVAAMATLISTTNAYAYPTYGLARSARGNPRRESYQVGGQRDRYNNRRNPYAEERPDKDDSTFYVPA